MKIGDFGLATSSKAAKAEVDIQQPSDSENDMTTGIGTSFYVSPEMLNANGTKYNQKIDMYSLGIIFFELMSPPFRTGMERIMVLFLV